MAVILIDSSIVTDMADPESVWCEWSASTLDQLDQNKGSTPINNSHIYAKFLRFLFMISFSEDVDWSLSGMLFMPNITMVNYGNNMSVFTPSFFN